VKTSLLIFLPSRSDFASWSSKNVLLVGIKISFSMNTVRPLNLASYYQSNVVHEISTKKALTQLKNLATSFIGDQGRDQVQFVGP
jgi:hypothetical protein